MSEVDLSQFHVLEGLPNIISDVLKRKEQSDKENKESSGPYFVEQPAKRFHQYGSFSSVKNITPISYKPDKQLPIYSHTCRYRDKVNHTVYLPNYAEVAISKAYGYSFHMNHFIRNSFNRFEYPTYFFDVSPEKLYSYYLRVDDRDVLLQHPRCWNFPDSSRISFRHSKLHFINGWLDTTIINDRGRQYSLKFKYTVTVTRRGIAPHIIDGLSIGDLPEWMANFGEVNAPELTSRDVFASYLKFFNEVNEDADSLTKPKIAPRDLLKAGLIESDDVYFRLNKIKLITQNIVAPDALDATITHRFQTSSNWSSICLKIILSKSQRRPIVISPKMVRDFAYMLGIGENYHYYWFALYCLDAVGLPPNWTRFVENDTLYYVNLTRMVSTNIENLSKILTLNHPRISELRDFLSDIQASDFRWSYRGFVDILCSECGVKRSVYWCGNCRDNFCVDCYFDICHLPGSKRLKTHYGLPIPGCPYLNRDEIKKIQSSTMNNPCSLTNVGYCNSRRFLSNDQQSGANGGSAICQCRWLCFPKETLASAILLVSEKRVLLSGPIDAVDHYYFNFEHDVITDTGNYIAKLSRDQQSALLIQRVARGWLIRLQNSRRLSAVIYIQSIKRMLDSQRVYGKHGQNAQILRSWYLKTHSQQNMDKLFYQISKVQAIAKSWLTRRQIAKWNESAKLIQSHLYYARRDRLEYLSSLKHIIHIQATYRRRRYGRRQIEVLWGKNASKIQKMIRGYLLRKSQSRQVQSAIKIQSIWRRYSTCKAIHKIRPAVILIQTFMRMKFAQVQVYRRILSEIDKVESRRSEIETMKISLSAAITIQRYTRGTFARNHYIMSKIKKIQSIKRLNSAVAGLFISITMAMNSYRGFNFINIFNTGDTRYINIFQDVCDHIYENIALSTNGLNIDYCANFILHFWRSSKNCLLQSNGISTTSAYLNTIEWLCISIINVIQSISFGSPRTTKYALYDYYYKGLGSLENLQHSAGLVCLPGLLARPIVNISTAHYVSFITTFVILLVRNSVGNDDLGISDHLRYQVVGNHILEDICDKLCQFTNVKISSDFVSSSSSLYELSVCIARYLSVLTKTESTLREGDKPRRSLIVSEEPVGVLNDDTIRDVDETSSSSSTPKSRKTNKSTNQTPRHTPSPTPRHTPSPTPRQTPTPRPKQTPRDTIQRPSTIAAEIPENRTEKINFFIRTIIDRKDSVCLEDMLNTIFFIFDRTRQISSNLYENRVKTIPDTMNDPTLLRKLQRAYGDFSAEFKKGDSRDSRFFEISISLLTYFFQSIFLYLKRERSATSIQVYFRYYLTRIKMSQSLISRVIKIQSIFRKFLVCRKIYVMKTSVNILSNFWLKKLLNKNSKTFIKSVDLIQKTIRGFLVRQWLKTMDKSAEQIQRIWRGFSTRVSFMIISQNHIVNFQENIVDFIDQRNSYIRSKRQKHIGQKFGQIPTDISDIYFVTNVKNLSRISPFERPSSAIARINLKKSSKSLSLGSPRPGSAVSDGLTSGITEKIESIIARQIAFIRDLDKSPDSSPDLPPIKYTNRQRAFNCLIVLSAADEHFGRKDGYNIVKKRNLKNQLDQTLFGQNDMVPINSRYFINCLLHYPQHVNKINAYKQKIFNKYIINYTTPIKRIFSTNSILLMCSYPIIPDLSHILSMSIIKGIICRNHYSRPPTGLFEKTLQIKDSIVYGDPCVAELNTLCHNYFTGAIKKFDTQSKSEILSSISNVLKITLIQIISNCFYSTRNLSNASTTTTSSVSTNPAMSIPIILLYICAFLKQKLILQSSHLYDTIQLNFSSEKIKYNSVSNLIDWYEEFENSSCLLKSLQVGVFEFLDETNNNNNTNSYSASFKDVCAEYYHSTLLYDCIERIEEGVFAKLLILSDIRKTSTEPPEINLKINNVNFWIEGMSMESMETEAFLLSYSSGLKTWLDQSPLIDRYCLWDNEVNFTSVQIERLISYIFVPLLHRTFFDLTNLFSNWIVSSLKGPNDTKLLTRDVFQNKIEYYKTQTRKKPLLLTSRTSHAFSIEKVIKSTKSVENILDRKKLISKFQNSKANLSLLIRIQAFVKGSVFRKYYLPLFKQVSIYSSIVNNQSRISDKSYDQQASIVTSSKQRLTRNQSVLPRRISIGDDGGRQMSMQIEKSLRDFGKIDLGPLPPRPSSGMTSGSSAEIMGSSARSLGAIQSSVSSGTPEYFPSDSLRRITADHRAIFLIAFLHLLNVNFIRRICKLYIGFIQLYNWLLNIFYMDIEQSEINQIIENFKSLKMVESMTYETLHTPRGEENLKKKKTKKTSGLKKKSSSSLSKSSTSKLQSQSVIIHPSVIYRENVAIEILSKTLNNQISLKNVLNLLFSDFPSDCDEIIAEYSRFAERKHFQSCLKLLEIIDDYNVNDWLSLSRGNRLSNTLDDKFLLFIYSVLFSKNEGRKIVLKISKYFDHLIKIKEKSPNLDLVIVKHLIIYYLSTIELGENEWMIIINKIFNIILIDFVENDVLDLYSILKIAEWNIRIPREHLSRGIDEMISSLIDMGGHEDLVLYLTGLRDQE